MRLKAFLIHNRKYIVKWREGGAVGALCRTKGVENTIELDLAQHYLREIKRPIWQVYKTCFNQRKQTGVTTTHKLMWLTISVANLCVAYPSLTSAQPTPSQTAQVSESTPLAKPTRGNKNSPPQPTRTFWDQQELLTPTTSSCICACCQLFPLELTGGTNLQY